MDEAQIKLLIKLLVDLKAENFALRKVVEQSGSMGAAGIDAATDAQRKHLLELPTISEFLRNPQEKQLATPLNTLLTSRLKR
jgi:hypothetical protein